jgi:hypothetical protein
MKVSFVCVITVAGLSVAVGRADDKAAASGDSLAPLARFIGDWTVDGKWSSGEVLHARASYAWGVNQKIILAKTFVKDGDKEYQRYESVLSYHPRKKSLIILGFDFEGGMTENRIDVKDADTLLIGWTPYAEGPDNNVRQTITFKDKDAFLWKVELKQKGAWQPIIEATWKRKAG